MVGKEVKTGTYAVICPREKGVNEYATPWMVGVPVASTWLSTSDIAK